MKLKYGYLVRRLQLSAPYSPQIKILLNAASAPGLTPGGLYQARFRPLKGGRPLEGFSAGHLFRYDTAHKTPWKLDGSYSGAWYDPSHSGEGFVVEVHDNAKALVYWFTYTASGEQRWMLGVGAVQDNSVVVEELLSPMEGILVTVSIRTM